MAVASTQSMHSFREKVIADFLTKEIHSLIWSLMSELPDAHIDDHGVSADKQKDIDYQRYDDIIRLILGSLTLIFAEDRQCWIDDGCRQPSLRALISSEEQSFISLTSVLEVFSEAHKRLQGTSGGLFDPTKYLWLSSSDDRFLWNIQEHESHLEKKEYKKQASDFIDEWIDQLLRLLTCPAGDSINYREFPIELLGGVNERLLERRPARFTGHSLALTKSNIFVDLDELLGVHDQERVKWLKKRGVSLSKSTQGLLKKSRTVDQLVSVLNQKRSYWTAHTLKPNSLLLCADGGRRQSGSHYTPRVLCDWVTLLSLPPLLDRSDQDEAKEVGELRVCDPAMGSGAFLLAVCRHLSSILLNTHRTDGGGTDLNESTALAYVARHCLFGVDLNPTAVELTKLSLWLLIGEGSLSLADLDHHFISAHSLMMPLNSESQSTAGGLRSDHAALGKSWQSAFPEVFNRVKPGFDLIIGNPPWRSLSGKGSPVAKLHRAGHLAEAKSVKENIDYLAQLYPEVSKKSKDDFKWFVGLADRIVRKDGGVSFILPSSVLTLPSYADVRRVLSRYQTLSMIQLGTSYFEVSSSSAVIVCRGKEMDVPEQRWVNHADLSFLEDRPRKVTALHRAFQAEQTLIEMQGTELLHFKSKVTEQYYRSCFPRLGEVLLIREGHHDLTWRQGDVKVPAIDDKSLNSLSPPKVREAYLPANKVSGSKALHSGPRLFIRKTGDRLVTAISPTLEYAVAHQNVYVCHAQDSSGLDIVALSALLSSELLSKLYREGPHGQTGRPLAQLRIFALRNLPIPPLHVLREKQDLLKTLYLSQNIRELNARVEALYEVK